MRQRKLPVVAYLLPNQRTTVKKLDPNEVIPCYSVYVDGNRKASWLHAWQVEDHANYFRKYYHPLGSHEVEIREEKRRRADVIGGF